MSGTEIAILVALASVAAIAHTRLLMMPVFTVEPDAAGQPRARADITERDFRLRSFYAACKWAAIGATVTLYAMIHLR